MQLLHRLLAALETSGELEKTVLEWVEIAALTIELLAVSLIALAFFYSTARYLYLGLKDRSAVPRLYRHYKETIGKTLLLALEILVAADIIETVALETTLASVLVLGLLVLTRTFLSWALIVELEGRWPWEPAEERENVEGGEIAVETEF